MTAQGGAADDEFGSAVAVSGDTLVVGADDDANSGIGAAYVFHRPASGWAHAQQVAVLKPSDGVSDDGFGDGVAISGGTIAVAAADHEVGANADQGAVYVFVEPHSGWSGNRHPAAELTASDGGTSDYLGLAAVGVSGNTVVAGAGYHEVGANTDQGAAYVFVRPHSGWSGAQHESAELTASDGAASDYLGLAAVGVSGNTVVAGAGYHQVGANTDQGAAYVFVRPHSGWSGTRHEAAELTESHGSAGDYLGYDSVAVSGGTVAAGAVDQTVGSSSDQGAGFVFTRPRSGWSGPRHQSAELVASDGAAGDYLGYAGVAISGNTVALDAADKTVGGNSDQGAVYAYARPTHGWSGVRQESAEKRAVDGTADDDLGYLSTALSGTTLVAGAPYHEVGTNTDQGAAYIFAPSRPGLSKLKETPHSWRERSKLASLNPAHKPKGGTRFSFDLSQAGTVTLRFVKHGHHKVAGTLSVSAPEGRNRLYFFGRISRHKSLSHGKYKVTFTTSNSAGVSKSHSVKFTVLKH